MARAVTQKDNADRRTVAMLFGVAVSVLATVAACGGQVGTTADGGGGSGSSGGGGGAGGSGGGGGGGGGGTPVTCTQSGGGGSSGGDAGCSVTSIGTCSDGTEYNVSCICPAGTCTCSKQTSSSGTATKTVSTECPEACELTATSSLIAACAFTTGGSNVTPPADAGLPACTIPSAMEPPSQPYAWSVGRALLDCKSAGLSTICISEDGTTCPNDPATVGAACTDVCAPDQYVVEYGGPPPFGTDAGYLTPPLLATCQGGTGFPSGTAAACCPCQ